MSRDIQQPMVANGEVTGEAAAAAQANSVPGIIIKKVKKEGEHLHVFLQSKNCQLLASPAAQRVAYEARLNHGFENAGINQYTSTYAVDLAEKDEDDLPGQQVPATAQALTELSARKNDLAYEIMISLKRGLR